MSGSAQVQTHRARHLWVRPGLSFSPGEIRVVDGKITGYGEARSKRVPDRAILPLLTNAHVHLQLAKPEGADGSDFVAWLRAVMAAGQTRTREEAIACARKGIVALRAEGVSIVGEIDSTGWSPEALRESDIRGYCFHELVGFDLNKEDATRLARETARRKGSRTCVAGLSPHAPYSCGKQLFLAVKALNRVMAIHVAESEEEVEFLRGGTGPLRELLAELGKLPKRWQPPGMSPVRWLDHLGVLGRRTVLVHAQHLEPEDARVIAYRGSSIVVCPGTIQYFGRTPPPVEAWRKQGIPVALGTDSLASNDRLSMRAEMARARELWPSLPPETVLAMATADGRRTLGFAGRAGFRINGNADFMTVPTDQGLEAFLDAFTANEVRSSGFWRNGVRSK